jgi:uncharacterized membrane protein
MITFILGLIALVYLVYRINHLESKLEQLTKGTHEPVVSTSVPTPVSTTPKQRPLSVSELIMQKSEESVATSPVLASAPEESKVHDTPSMVPEVHKDNTEFAVGSKVLTGVGVFALFLGVVFFLRYAFDNNLISEPLRVVLGIILGIIVGVIGHLLKKKYDGYGLTLVGAGHGIIYLSIYAAYAFYELINVPTAFIILCGITILGVGVSVAYNSLRLSAYAFFGAFLVPLLLPLNVSVHILFIYLAILAGGIALIARFKQWPELTAGSLIGVSLVSLKWVSTVGVHDLFFETCIYLTILYGLYIVTTIINFIRRDRNYKSVDGFLLYAVPTIYFGLNALMLHTRGELALLMLGIGIFYGLVAIVLRAGLAQAGEIPRLSNAMILISAVAIVAATSLHFENYTNTILWALEALVILSIGIILQSRANRIASMLLIGLMVCRAIFFDLSLPSSAMAIFNTRSLVLLCALIPCIVLWAFYTRYGAPTVHDGEEQQVGRYIGALGIFMLPLIWICAELPKLITVDYNFYIPLTWTIFIAIMVGISFLAREIIFRVLSYILGGITLLLIISSLWTLPQSHYVAFINIRVLTVLLFVLTLGFITWLLTIHWSSIKEQEKQMRAICLGTINGLLLWLVSIEILDYFNHQIRAVGYRETTQTLENTKRVVLSIAWLVYALVTLAGGIMYHSSALRKFSIVLFAFTIIKIFLYDTSNLSDIYRFVSFITLGVILMIAGFAYYRFKDRIIQFVK